MKLHERLPLFHPTTVVYVDDDGEFLQLLPAATGILPYQTFGSPGALLKDVQDGNVVSQLRLHCFSHRPPLDSDGADERVIGVDQWMIYLRVFNRHRFELATVFVIDYDMPEMSGLTVCHHLADYPCKKILLTGYGSHELAIQALNDGLIDMYVEKSHPQLTRYLGECIEVLQERYFADTTRAIKELLSHDHHVLWCDDAVWTLFRQHAKDREVVEYYFVSEPCAILALDAFGAGHLWLVYDEAALTAESITARRLGAPDAVVARLEGRRAVPFITQRDARTCLDATVWWESLLPLEPVPGRPGIFYAITDGAAPYKIDEAAVLSYAQYIDSTRHQ